MDMMEASTVLRERALDLCELSTVVLDEARALRAMSRRVRRVQAALPPPPTVIAYRTVLTARYGTPDI